MISDHTFHIPVMGLAYTVDSPIKVARYGITSVVSIIQDHLLEQMREYYEKNNDQLFIAISETEDDYRAKRITAYLNMMNRVVTDQIEKLKAEDFIEGNDIVKYFELLPDNSSLKSVYIEMTKMSGSEKEFIQDQLRKKIHAGKIDVNIMTKLDKLNRNSKGDLLPAEYADAMSALRGYALSDLDSSVVFSAGLNPRLFGYIEKFSDFFPTESGAIKKRVILKVSDYRSALIQGKILAKKGIWVSEFRVESGLNCGGHAFPTEGRLIGPILEEFKNNREILNDELFTLCNNTLKEQNRITFKSKPGIRITFQGGIGTYQEDRLLREYYNLDGTGWGSPFLLVPEATNVDDQTLIDLTEATKEDYFMSYASPLGIPFNNFRRSSSEKQRTKRIEKNRPGSPCYLKYLAFNTEFNSEKPICIASREYQNLKLKELENMGYSDDRIKIEKQKILEKDCLCEGLSSSVILKNNLPLPHNLEAVTICPGPNLAYFSRVLTLEQIVGHIYGRQDVLNTLNRPHLFINELKLYFGYLKEEIKRNSFEMSDKQIKYLNSLVINLSDGLNYYKEFFAKTIFIFEKSSRNWLSEIREIEFQIDEYCSSEQACGVFA